MNIIINTLIHFVRIPIQLLIFITSNHDCSMLIVIFNLMIFMFIGIVIIRLTVIHSCNNSYSQTTEPYPKHYYLCDFYYYP